MSARPGRARFDEAAARDVLLLQAFESIEPLAPSWTADDAAWATRAAREAGASRSAEAFLATRAALALRRLLPREPALAALRTPRRIGTARGLGLAVAIGGAVGLAADAIGGSQRINLLAPPVWTVVVWNLAVYALLIAAAAGRVLGAARDGGPGPILRAVERLARVARRRGGGPAPAGSAAGALRSFALRWSSLAAPLAASRAAVLLHAAAAALGAGLVAGLYARGLVLDYRVAWESTFLSPADVHAVLSTLLAPASRLSGIALPDLAAVAALRAAHGDAGVGAPAAPWIHLYAWTLAVAVVVPRAALAVLGAIRVRHAAGRLALPLGEAYFMRLERARRGEAVRVALAPYAQPPSAAALAGLRTLLVDVFGDALTVDVAPTTPFGGEDDGVAPPPGAAVVVALFDLGATPEPEHHGRFVGHLAAGASAAGGATIVVVDETAFLRRFGGVGGRVAERRAAWTRLFAGHGTKPVFTALEAPEPAAGVAALRGALAAPAR